MKNTKTNNIKTNPKYDKMNTRRFKFIDEHPIIATLIMLIRFPIEFACIAYSFVFGAVWLTFVILIKIAPFIPNNPSKYPINDPYAPDRESWRTHPLDDDY